jgi:hypothetical protein
MSESMPTNINELSPGDVIEFKDVTELPAFEDIVALTIEPEPTGREWDFWRGRQHIRDFIRPAKFNGSIRDIRLQVMEEPYEQLVGAPQRGIMVDMRGKNRRTSLHSVETFKRYRGFVLTAEGVSSRSGGGGHIQTELWYYPSAMVMSRGKLVRDSQQRSTSFVNRVIARPYFEDDRFRELYETSRKVGFEALRQAMTHPLIQPITQ